MDCLCISPLLPWTRAMSVNSVDSGVVFSDDEGSAGVLLSTVPHALTSALPWSYPLKGSGRIQGFLRRHMYIIRTSFAEYNEEKCRILFRKRSKQFHLSILWHLLIRYLKTRSAPNMKLALRSLCVWSWHEQPARIGTRQHAWLLWLDHLQCPNSTRIALFKAQLLRVATSRGPHGQSLSSM